MSMSLFIRLRTLMVSLIDNGAFLGNGEDFLFIEVLGKVSESLFSGGKRARSPHTASPKSGRRFAHLRGERV